MFQYHQTVLRLTFSHKHPIISNELYLSNTHRHTAWLNAVNTTARKFSDRSCMWTCAMCCRSALYVRRVFMWQWQQQKARLQCTICGSDISTAVTLSTLRGLLGSLAGVCHSFPCAHCITSPYVKFPCVKVTPSLRLLRYHVGRTRVPVVYWPGLTRTVTQLCNFHASRSCSVLHIQHV